MSFCGGKARGRVGRGCGFAGGLTQLKPCFAVNACVFISVLYFKKKHVHAVRPSIPGPSTCAVHAFISVLHFVVVASKAYLSSQMLNTCAK